MGISGILILLIFAVAGCARHIPVLETPDDISTTMVQPDRHPTAKSEAKKPAPLPPAAASTTAQADTISSTTPKVGSPQKWEKAQAEEERKERHLKQVIEGICH